VSVVLVERTTPHSLLNSDDGVSGDLSPKEKERRACVHIFHTAHFLVGDSGMNGKAPVSRKSFGARVDLMFAQPLPGIDSARYRNE